MENLLSYFGNTILAMFFISLLSGILGSYIFVNRLNYFAGGIAHASFGGVGLAFLLGFNPFFGAVGAAALIGIVLGLVYGRDEFSSDSSIGMLWAFGMAVGILFANLTKGYKPNLLSFLFGDILIISNNFVVVLAIVSIVVLILSIIFYNRLLFISFDREFAKISGYNITVYNIIIFVLMSISIVFVIKSSGLILVISMLTIPVMISKLITKNIKLIALLSFFVAFIIQIAGLLLSIEFNFATGPVIIILLTLSYLLMKLIKRFV